jgi:hypothetical protein
MPVELILAPPAAGKTAACIQRIQSVRKTEPLAPVWVLVPDAQNAAYFRQRLARAGGALGVSVGTFRALYTDLLERQGNYTPVITPRWNTAWSRVLWMRPTPPVSWRITPPSEPNPGSSPPCRTSSPSCAAPISPPSGSPNTPMRPSLPKPNWRTCTPALSISWRRSAGSTAMARFGIPSTSLRKTLVPPHTSACWWPTASVPLLAPVLPSSSGFQPRSASC